MKRSSFFVFALGATTLVACGGLKDALTAHVDVVARAGSQELSVNRLSDMLGNAKAQIPINRDVATLIARDLWVPYQLLGEAAAHGDSLNDPKAIDAAAAGMVENAKLGKFMESVSSSLPSDSGSQGAYESGKGDLYAAHHILFLVPKGAPAAVKDSIHKKAESVRAQVTNANFAEMAKKYSQDNTAAKGGDLGVFPRSMMVKSFGDAVAALKPGQISPLVETEYGYHIIERSTWDEAKGQYSQQAGGRTRQVAESTYIAAAQAAAKVQVKGNAAAVAKSVAKDPMEHRNDNTVIATFSGGDFTAGRLATVVLAMPQSGRITQQIQAAPDSIVSKYVMSMAEREVLLKRADSAKMGPTAEDIANLHRDFVQAVGMSWQALGIDPKSLADSAKTPAERERLAASRVEAYLDKVMNGLAQPVPVPAPLQIVLMNKYDSKINAAGIDRAVERAQHVRATADSARAVNQPKSAVPLPGAGMGAGAPSASPSPSAAPAPAPATPSPAPAKP